MKVLYDHQIFTWQRYGGISNSFVQLIQHLPQNVEFEISVKFSDNFHLINSNLKKVNPLFKPEKFKREGISPKYWFYSHICSIFPGITSAIRNKKESIRLLTNNNFDVFHPTFFDDYFLPYLNGKPFVLTVHDMIPELFNRKDTQIELKRILVKDAAHIITVSERTKSDLVDILNVPNEKITTIYHGAPNNRNNSYKDIMEGKKYILFVGKRNGYKAFTPMIRSIGSWLRSHPDIIVVCTGDSFSTKEIAIFLEENIEKQVLHIRPDDNDLKSLYHNALCFVFPSYYEGFGIPILEAYSTDCPVFLSRHSCFPEIAGDAAIYFNIDDTGSTLPMTLDDFLSWNNEKKNKLLQKQRERLALFSWEKSARKLAEVYEMVKR